jgi:pimeloyl-ACP methyl ester carboxylesterase
MERPDDQAAGDLSRIIERPDWDQWINGARPRAPRTTRVQEVQARFEANGYAWDIHGSLVSPVSEPRSQKFVLTHGGAGSEKELLETPDGRPGLAIILAELGYETLVISFVGHYPRGSVWPTDVERRLPVYLLGRDIPEAEILSRNLVCAFDVHVQGMATLIEQAFQDQNLIVFGHSTGGPMVVALPRFLCTNTITGIVGWGSSEPNLWAREWSHWIRGKPTPAIPIDKISRRLPGWFRSAGYEDERELCPWGGAEDYSAWADRNKSQFKTSLCDNQHHAIVETFGEYAGRSGQPLEAYTTYLQDPDPTWLRRIGVLLMVGEKDSRLWGGDTPHSNRQLFASAKYELRAGRARTIVVPRLGHFGFVGLHNEQIVYRWVEAIESGFFNVATQPAPADALPH